AFHQPRAVARGLRAVGSQVRTATAQPVARREEESRRRMTMTSETTSFIYVTYIASTPEKVFEAITKPDIARRYWGHENVSDWQPGSRWEHVRADDARTVELVGDVVEISPPSRLVITWAAASRAADPESYSRVTFDIAEYEGMVRLTVTHDELEAGSGR